MKMPPDFLERDCSLKPNLQPDYNQKAPVAMSCCFDRLAFTRSGSILRILFIFTFILVIGTSCVGKRLSKANVDEVTEGMSKKQVESILGPPTNIDNKDFIVLKKTTYVYRQGKDTVTIVFKDDKVTDKQSTLSD
jgi:hypothetical protein